MSADAAFDCIVVGAGIVGLSAASHIAQSDNARVLLLEQYALPHWRGSSGGQTRITRLAYKDVAYVRMVMRAHDKWRQLERDTDSQLLRRTGAVLIGSGNSALIGQYEAAMLEATDGRIGARMSRNELCERFGSRITPPQGSVGIWDPEAGILYANRCLAAYTMSCRSNNVQIKDEAPVAAIIPGKLVTVVTTKEERFYAKTLAICCGPWSAPFLKDTLNMELPLRVRRTYTIYWKESQKDAYSALKGAPAFIIKDDSYGAYMKPSLEFPRLVHIGITYNAEDRPGEAIRAPELLEEYANKTRKYIRDYGLKLDSTSPVSAEQCFITWTPDEDFVLDNHPQHKNIVIAAGFSGHGFKQAPVIGEIIRDLIQGQPIPPEYRASFSIQRFRSTAKI